MKSLRSVAIYCFLFAIPGCSRLQSVDPAIPIDNRQYQLNAASARARATSRDFIRVLKAPRENQLGFSIRVSFTEEKVSEDLWLQPVAYDGERFRGVVNNQPQRLQAFKPGEEIAVDPRHLLDWMYVEEGRLVGGYTIRAERARLSDAERARFDESLPFKFD